MLRIPHCLDNRLTDGGKVVSPTLRPLLYSPETLFFMLLVLISVRGWVNPRAYSQEICALGVLGREENSSELEVYMTNAFWDITPCGSSKNQRFWEHIASIFRLIRLSFLSSHQGYAPRRRLTEPLANSDSTATERNSCWGTVAIGSLTRPPWRISLVSARKPHSLITLKLEAICSQKRWLLLELHGVIF
jgi:hypothetical protein